jgi:hypothetical protein
MNLFNLIRRAWSYKNRKRLPRDEYVDWIRMVNSGMLHEGNLYLFNYCVTNLPSNAPIIEIGSFAGLSSNILSHYLRRANKPNSLISIDPWEFEGMNSGATLPGSNVTFRECRETVIEHFRRNVSLFSADHMPRHVSVTSDEFFELWEKNASITDFFGKETRLGGPISTAYIDGDHTYEQSFKDFRNVDRFLEVGGYIIFDDSADWSDWGSRKAAQEAARWPSYRLVVYNPNYCIQKVSN